MNYANDMPQHVAKLARTDIGLAQALSGSVARLNRRLRQERRSDLTPTQISVLGEIRRAGTITPSELAAAERVQPPSMTRIINHLDELGYLTRTAHPSDGRQIVLSLSEPGKEKLATERKRRDLWLADRLRELDPTERQALRTAAVILEKVSTA